MRQRPSHQRALARRVLLCSLLGFLLLALAPYCLESLVPARLQILASARADEIVYACGLQNGPSAIFSGSETFGLKTINYCGGGGVNYNLEIKNDYANLIQPGKFSSLVASAPPGLVIAEASVPSIGAVSTVGNGYLAYFIWGTGSQRVDDSWTTFDVKPNPPATAFGFLLECNPSGSKCPSNGALIGMNQVMLHVRETVNPTVVAGGSWNLWNQGARWLRGNWPLSFSSDAPSGIDSMSASVNGKPIDPLVPVSCWPGSNSGPISTVWEQCWTPQTWSANVALSGTGDQPLTLNATSAAANTSSPSETIHVDSAQPTISFNGPTQASSAAGTQYVSATANVGPSGLGSITCSTDGGPAQSYSRSPASIPVSGLGMHTIRCTASNRSYDTFGRVAVSAPTTWSLDIRQPTVSGVAFAKLVGALKCKRILERVKVPARWVSVTRSGKAVTVKRRERTRIAKVIKCHPQIARRTVTVWVEEKRHGKTVRVKRKRVERVVVVPHVVGKASRRVAFGKGTTVSGWLGTSSYTALGGRPVQVTTAPDNGSGAWSQAAVVTTAPDGTWSAQLPRGPSRLVEAIYNGDAMTEPSTSNPIHLIVPAKVKLRIRPRRVAWGRTIRITGHVLGGYIPRGKLLRLRIGVQGLQETVGIPNIRPNGRFSTTWTFASGTGLVRYWFSISTLNEADYPFAPASSRRVYVTVGP